MGIFSDNFYHGVASSYHDTLGQDLQRQELLNQLNQNLNGGGQYNYGNISELTNQIKAININNYPISPLSNSSLYDTTLQPPTTNMQWLDRRVNEMRVKL